MLSGKRAYNLHTVRTSSLKIILRDQAQDSANGFQKFKLNFFLYACFLTHNLTSPSEVPGQLTELRGPYQQRSTWDY